METVLTHCTNLVRVHLDEFPEIDNERILKKIVELPYLSDLEISGCKNIDNNLLYNIQKGLISLSLPRTNFTGECLVAFSFLGRLNISGCSDISTTNVIVSLSAYCLQLRELYMGNMKDFPEFGLQNIIRAQTWLRKLDISHCSRAVAVINGTKPPCLRSLNLAFCKELISAQDLINLSEYLSGISELTISGAKLENELRANMENCNWSMSIVNLDKSIPPAAEPKRQEEKPKKIVIEIDEVLRNTKTRSARHRRKDREKAVAENAGKKTTQVCIDDDELDDYL